MPRLELQEPPPIVFFVPILPMVSEPEVFEVRKPEILVPTDETPAEVLDLDVPRMELARVSLVLLEAILNDELEEKVEISGRGDLDRGDRVDASEPLD